MGAKSAVVTINSSGTETWKSGLIDANMQANDIELASDGFVIVGHTYGKQSENCFPECGVIKGHMKKLSGDGTIKWTQDYGNYKGGVN